MRREVREREKNKEEEGQRREPSRVSLLSPRCFFFLVTSLRAVPSVLTSGTGYKGRSIEGGGGGGLSGEREKERRSFSPPASPDLLPFPQVTLDRQAIYVSTHNAILSCVNYVLTPLL